jgi:hypothetical protein
MHSAAMADATSDFLTARSVRNFVRIGFVNDKNPKLVYSLDSFDTNDQKTLLKGLTLRTEDEIAVYIADFNPLRDSFTVDSKETPSPNYGAIKAFLDDLKILQQSLPPVGEGTSDTTSQRTTRCDRLRKLIATAQEALSATELTPQNLNDMAVSAIGFEGVHNVIIQLTGTSNNLKANMDKASKAIESIVAEFSHVKGAEPQDSCATIDSAILVDYVSVTGSAAQVLAQKSALKQVVDGLVTSLGKIDDADDWRGANDNLTDYVFTRLTPTFEKDQTVTVTAVRRTITVEDGVLSIGNADKTKQEVAFLVKRDSFFVTERAVAGIYNHLKYPKYGTAKNDAGETVVERSKDDYDPVNAAMMLNMVMRTKMGSVAYPMLQLGVSTAKDFPGLLAGIGLRFTQPSAFSLSVGGMITRYKDLDGVLKPGDKVTGTSDIESHLEFKTSPVVLYGAIQLKF